MTSRPWRCYKVIAGVLISRVLTIHVVALAVEVANKRPNIMLATPSLPAMANALGSGKTLENQSVLVTALEDYDPVRAVDDDDHWSSCPFRDGGLG
jgi:hypothetical protein